jgi:Anti-sigma factor NepR
LAGDVARTGSWRRVACGREKPSWGQVDTRQQGNFGWTASVAKHVRKTSDPTVQAAIGRKLRALYDEVANEPVPERFSELLKQLADQENQDR